MTCTDETASWNKYSSVNLSSISHRGIVIPSFFFAPDMRSYSFPLLLPVSSFSSRAKAEGGRRVRNGRSDHPNFLLSSSEQIGFICERFDGISFAPIQQCLCSFFIAWNWRRYVSGMAISCWKHGVSYNGRGWNTQRINILGSLGCWPDLYV
jgi:hypothetical protein